MDKPKCNRGNNPNSIKNLKPQRAGEPSHNPRGRPKKADCLLECINSELAKPSINPLLTNEQLIASMLVAQATKGNLKATELLMSYTIRKPTASVDVTSGGKAIQIKEVEVRLSGSSNPG